MLRSILTMDGRGVGLPSARWARGSASATSRCSTPRPTPSSCALLARRVDDNLSAAVMEWQPRSCSSARGGVHRAVHRPARPSTTAPWRFTRGQGPAVRMLTRTAPPCSTPPTPRSRARTGTGARGAAFALNAPAACAPTCCALDSWHRSSVSAPVGLDLRIAPAPRRPANVGTLALATAALALGAAHRHQACRAHRAPPPGPVSCGQTSGARRLRAHAGRAGRCSICCATADARLSLVVFGCGGTRPRQRPLMGRAVAEAAAARS